MGRLVYSFNSLYYTTDDIQYISTLLYTALELTVQWVLYIRYLTILVRFREAVPELWRSRLVRYIKEIGSFAPHKPRTTKI